MYRVGFFLTTFRESTSLGFIDFECFDDAKRFSESFTREFDALTITIEEV